VIDYDRPDVIHVEAQGVAEQEDKDKRDGEGEVQAPVVPDEMIKFLAGYGGNDT
jgi:hypothetical protein